MAKRKTIAFAVIFFAALLFSGYLAQAQQSPRGKPSSGTDPRMGQMADMMFRDMDTNHDGKISKSEWQAFQDKQFDKIDKDRKGYVTKDDVVADMEQMRREQMSRRGPAPGQ